MGVRRGIEIIKREEEKGIMMRVIRLKGGEIWRIVGVYINNVEEKWGKLREWIEGRERGGQMIIGGDFNARTGELGGWWEGKDERGEEEGRRSRDKKVNKEGKYLVERLGEVGWFVFNGCGKGDELGSWTYAGGRGESVIDYVLGDGEAWDRVERLEVKNRIESDHFPIEVWLKGEGEGRVKRASRRGRSGRWTEERMVKFKGRMEDWWEEKRDGEREYKSA